MRLVAIILALFVAFPNMGYALTSSCCSHEKVKHDSCEDEVFDLTHESQDSEDDKPCGGQCDCSCCAHTFLIKDNIVFQDKTEIEHHKTTPISAGTPFRQGIYNLIWQPPQLG
jgi:hypothetical protein